MAGTAIVALAAIPIGEAVLRRTLGVGIPAAGPIAQHLVLWVAFLGAAIAARDGGLLSFSGASLAPDGPWRRALVVAAAACGACVALILAWGGIELLRIERESASSIGAGIPTWVTQLVFPIGLGLIAWRQVRHGGERWIGRWAAASGLAVAAVLLWNPRLIEGAPAWPIAAAAVIAAAAGTPIFAVLGGMAALLFMADGVTPAAVLVETYALNTSPMLPAIPLFTLAGFLLAEGRTPTRLLRVFRAGCGWMPGGTAVVCVLLCSFFSVFTGGSGVTILALGGLLFPALLADGYRERFAVGLLTGSGSLGLLLPPALPLILYGVVAQLPLEDLFIAGLLPGMLLMVLGAAWGVREGLVRRTGRQAFSAPELGRALWGARWEVLMPALVLAVLITGLATAVEAAAIAALYALVIQLARRDIADAGQLRRVIAECVSVVGGVLLILGTAVGLTSFLVSAGVPALLLSWTREWVASPVVFLLALNGFLLLVGCVMDIFSAIVVVVPLVAPLAEAYGIHPVHLGILFIANLELGYLTPPVGLNLFLASYRFKRPVLDVARAALPMLGILGAGVLLITYVPALSLALLRVLGRL
ncbi:MAG: TRAP transporter large permease subunit [Vicinamibacterales bacterium]